MWTCLPEQTAVGTGTDQARPGASRPRYRPRSAARPATVDDVGDDNFLFSFIFCPPFLFPWLLSLGGVVLVVIASFSVQSYRLALRYIRYLS